MAAGANPFGSFSSMAGGNSPNPFAMPSMGFGPSGSMGGSGGFGGFGGGMGGFGMGSAGFSPSSGINEGLSNINQAFSSINGMFNPPSTGIPGDTRSSTPTGTTGNFMGQPFSGGYSGGFGPYGSSPQPISGASNSLTAQLRATENNLGTMGPSLFQAGGGLIQGGLGVTQGGLNVMGGGLNTLNTPQSYYQGILSANPAMATALAAPQAQAASTVESNALTQANQGIRGGFTAQQQANYPQMLANLVGTNIQQQIPTALAGLTGIGTTQAQIGQGMGQLGQGITNAGTTLTGQGTQTEEALANALINNQQVDQQVPGVFQDILSAVQAAPSAVLTASGIGSMIANGFPPA